MSLSYLNTENVKGLKNDHYSLKPVTYVQGDNRSGKTAILQAIQQAVFGRSDEIGAKGAGSLVHRDHSSCSMECGGDMVVFRAGVSINKKGAVSQSRSCTIEGKEVVEDEVMRLVGYVPTTVAGFKDLTGEQVWRLIMPSGESQSLPEHIMVNLKSLCDKLQECGFDVGGIMAHTQGDTDCFSRATALLEAINSKQRDVREKARALLTAMEPPEKPYTGPSVGDLKLEEKSLKDQINRFQESHRQRAKSEETIRYNEDQIARYLAANEDSQKTIDKIQASINKSVQLCFDISQILAVIPDYIDVKLSGSGFFDRKVEDLIETIHSLNPNHEICQASTRLVELISQYITQNTYKRGDNPDLDALIQAADTTLERPVVGSITKKAYEAALLAVRGLLSNSENSLENEKGVVSKRCETIRKLQEENVSLREVVSTSQDSVSIETAAQRLSAVSGLIAQAQDYATAISRAQQARTDSTLLLSTDPYFSSTIDVIQVYRAKALKEGIDVVTEKANAIIGYCDLPPIVLTPVAGKRPSLSICNSVGSQIMAMSGAERLIYYSALILAIQSVHKVVAPLLFLEGGELDIAFTQKLLLALAKHFKANPGGNVFIAHHLESRVSDPYLGVIHV